MASQTTSHLKGVSLSGEYGLAVGEGGAVIRFFGTHPKVAGGVCTESIPVYCGQTVFGSNVSQPSRFSVACVGARPDSGPEVIYRIEAPNVSSVTALLNPGNADLDLVVLSANGLGGCNTGGSCVARSQTAGTGNEQVTFPVTRGNRYFLAVDGYASAQAGYSLQITCTK
jgi:hypothetical protein